MSESTFLLKARGAVALLRAQDAQLEAQERGVRQKRLSLTEEIERLETAMATFNEVMADTSIVVGEPVHYDNVALGDDGEPVATMLHPDEVASMTIVQAVAVLLERWGGEGMMQDIVAELKAVGKVNGANPVNTVSTQLRRFPKQFQWVSRGRWRLLPSATP